jgi:hypothetical protein
VPSACTNESGVLGGSCKRNIYQLTYIKLRAVDSLSSSISSSSSTSSPVSRSSARISRLASFGRLKLVLRLELPLPERPDALPERPETDPDLPLLENEVRREEGPEPSAPVGEGDIMGDVGLDPFVQTYCPFKSRFGISVVRSLARDLCTQRGRTSNLLRPCRSPRYI